VLSPKIRGAVVGLALVASTFAGLSLWGSLRVRPKPLLEVFEDAARLESRPGFRAAALAELASANARMGDLDTARHLVREAERPENAQPDTFDRAWTLARLAEVMERADGKGAGRTRFLESLATIEANLLPGGVGSREALSVWLCALAASPGSVDGPLVARGLGIVAAGDDVLFDAEAATALAALGQGEKVRELDLLRFDQGRRWLAPLAALDSRCSLGSPRSRKLLERALLEPEELRHDGSDALVPALRGVLSPWEIGRASCRERVSIDV
jgi:hypothetical protein